VARRYLLDTHACVLMLAEPKKLGARARAAIEHVEAGRDEAFLSAVVVAELLMLKDLGRISIGLPQLKAAMEQTPSFRFLGLDLDQLDQFAALASMKDPFDRLIVSAARSIRARLITKDAAISESGLVETVWA
jgi:PIN domain nuclease of toxin-antitoxin system